MAKKRSQTTPRVAFCMPRVPRPFAEQSRSVQEILRRIRPRDPRTFVQAQEPHAGADALGRDVSELDHYCNLTLARAAWVVIAAEYGPQNPFSARGIASEIEAGAHPWEVRAMKESVLRRDALRNGRGLGVIRPLGRSPKRGRETSLFTERALLLMNAIEQDTGRPHCNELAQLFTFMGRPIRAGELRLLRLQYNQQRRHRSR
jgi:hypothetical protein